MHEKLRHSLQLTFLHKKENQDNRKHYYELKLNVNALQLTTRKMYTAREMWLPIYIYRWQMDDLGRVWAGRNGWIDKW